MVKKQEIEILTLRGLAKRIGKSYDALRIQLMREQQKGGLIFIDGYRLFGQKNKAWFACDGSKYDVKIIDDETETPG